MIFQLMFAIITAAVVSGSVAGRMRLGPWTLFSTLWNFFVYIPLARWVFYSGGWLAQWGVLDFAGGIPVETASGVSALVLAFWLDRHQRLLDEKEDGDGDRRVSTESDGLEHGLIVNSSAETDNLISKKSSEKEHPVPHNVPFILLGAVSDPSLESIVRYRYCRGATPACSLVGCCFSPLSDYKFVSNNHCRPATSLAFALISPACCLPCCLQAAGTAVLRLVWFQCWLRHQLRLPLQPSVRQHALSSCSGYGWLGVLGSNLGWRTEFQVLPGQAVCGRLRHRCCCRPRRDHACVRVC